MLTAAHELTHFIREFNEAGYAELREYITGKLLEQGTDIEELITRKMAREKREMSYNDAMEEVIADACEMMLTDPSALNELASDHSSLAKKIRTWLNDFIAKLKKAFTGLEAAHDEAKAMAGYMDELRTMWGSALSDAARGMANKNAAETGDGKMSVREIERDGVNYGIGVYLDSTLLENLTDDERVQMVKERVKELGGHSFTAYDDSGNAVSIKIAEARERFKNKNGKKVSVTEDLATKYSGNKIKQESVVLADELITTAKSPKESTARYPHGWLDNYGKNKWEQWTSYIQDKSGNVWAATLHVANARDGLKYLYDINPIKAVNPAEDTKKVERRGKSRTPLLAHSITDSVGNVNTEPGKSSARDLTDKYPYLNLNEDISELDGVPAIELADGSILPITERDGRYPTHVSFIEGNRIELDDLKSGGWIGNGVYDPSFTSDTQRYIERQQARKRVAELTGKEYKQFGDVKYSLREFEDGTKFVDVQANQDEFDGLSPDDMQAKAREIIKRKFVGKIVGSTNKAFVNGRTANEYAYPARFMNDSQIKEAKMRTSGELGNLLDAGTNYRTEADGADGHMHKNASGGFSYYDAIFKVGSEYYSGVINIVNTTKGSLLKDVTKIRNITEDISSSYGANPKSTFLSDVSENSIRDTAGNVNTQDKYSMRDVTEGDTKQELEERKKAYAQLRRENAALKARVEQLKGQTKLTKEATVREADTAALAKRLLKDYTSRADSAEIQRQLQELGNYIVQNDGRTLSYDEIRERADSIAEEIADDAFAVLSPAEESLAEYTEYLKNTPVKITDGTAGDFVNGAYREISRRIKLRNDGRGVDSVWQELQGMFGEDSARI